MKFYEIIGYNLNDYKDEILTPEFIFSKRAEWAFDEPISFFLGKEENGEASLYFGLVSSKKDCAFEENEKMVFDENITKMFKRLIDNNLSRWKSMFSCIDKNDLAFGIFYLKKYY